VAILERSEVPALLDSFRPSGGRPRQLSSAGVLLGVLAALDSGRPAHLRAAWQALGTLEPAQRLRLGAACTTDDGLVEVTYRQFSDAFAILMAPIDPSPVPSFRGVAEDERGTHLASVRDGVDEEVCAARLAQVADALLEASVPEPHKTASSSFAVDWTDHESFARPRAKDDPQPSADPDASWGHAKRNAPGASDHLFYGYYAQVATMVPDERGPAVPELVRRICVEAPRTDPAELMARTLVRMSTSGVALGDVIADCGYSNREPAHFARPLRAAGARLVFDLHPADRGPRGTFEGAICANGSLYCPATPSVLLGLGPLRRGADATEVAAHEKSTGELSRYRFGRIAGPDADGFERAICPAAAGRLRCPLRPASMAAANDRPSVLNPPERRERCCCQQTITVPPEVNEKTRQAHEYLGAAHRGSYARRTASERSFAEAADPAQGGVRRGWCCLFGVAKNTLMYALVRVVLNVRRIEAFERRRAESERRGSPERRRKRRRRARRPVTSETVGEIHESPD